MSDNKKYLKHKKVEKLNFSNFLPETTRSDGGYSFDRGAPENGRFIISKNLSPISLLVAEK